jgi:hypothetical protein
VLIRAKHDAVTAYIATLRIKYVPSADSVPHSGWLPTSLSGGAGSQGRLQFVPGTGFSTWYAGLPGFIQDRARTGRRCNLWAGLGLFIGRKFCESGNRAA